MIDGDERASYLKGGRVPPGAVEQRFRASEALYRGAPWTHAHDEQVVRFATRSTRTSASPRARQRYDRAKMAQQLKTSRPRRRVQAARRAPKARGQRPAAPPFKYRFQPKAFYTPGEVAEILRVSSQTVLDWIHKDRLDAVQLSERVYRIPLGGLLIHLGEPPRVTRVIGRYRRRDDLQDERALAREHGIELEHR